MYIYELTFSQHDRKIADLNRRRKHSTTSRISDQAKSPLQHLSVRVVSSSRIGAFCIGHTVLSQHRVTLFHLSTDSYTYPLLDPGNHLYAVPLRSIFLHSYHSFIWPAEFPTLPPVLFSSLLSRHLPHHSVFLFYFSNATDNFFSFYLTSLN